MIMITHMQPSRKIDQYKSRATSATAAFAAVILLAAYSNSGNDEAASNSERPIATASSPRAIKAPLPIKGGGTILSGDAEFTQEKQAMREHAAQIENSREAQEALNTAVEQLFATTFSDLPEKISAFKETHPMTFHQYHSEGVVDPQGKPYERILSQSCDSMGCSTIGSYGDNPGSTEPEYSFLITYGDNPSGPRTFTYVDLMIVNHANPETMDDPQLNGFQTLNELRIGLREDNTWSVSYKNQAEGIDTGEYYLESEYKGATAGEMLRQVEVFNNLLSGNAS